MPTYLYKNLETGEIYEIRQSMKDAPLTTHPDTGVAIKRVLARPGIAFKGSGFYVTDSRASQNTAKGSGQDSGSKGGGSE